VKNTMAWSVVCASTLAMAAGLGGFLGCSSDSGGGGTPVADTGGDGTSETTPPSDSGDSAVGDTGGDTPITSTKGGSISLSQTTTVAGSTTIYTTVVSAGFSNGGSTSTGFKCTSSKIGGCDVFECDLTPAGDAGVDGGTDSGTVKAPTAGDITLTGGKIASAGIVLTADATTGLYKAVTGTTKLFDGGETITAKAAGDVVPAFDGKTVAAPGDIKLTSPACASFACPDLDRTVDLNATWTGGSSGNVVVSLSTSQKDKRSASILCTFKAADGKGTISKDALAKLDKADGTTITGFESFGPSNSTSFKSGDYDILLIASATGASGTFKASK
jgi:hypothetical protein